MIIKMNKEKIKELCIAGLQTDGGHHKQWYLEEILKACGYNLRKLSIEICTEEAIQENEDPKEYCEFLEWEEIFWEKGIPP